MKETISWISWVQRQFEERVDFGTFFGVKRLERKQGGQEGQAVPTALHKLCLQSIAVTYDSALTKLQGLREEAKHLAWPAASDR